MSILLEILAVAALAVGCARCLPAPWRGRALNTLKAWVTVRAFWLLLAHPFAVEPAHVAHLAGTGWIPQGAARVEGWRLILAQLRFVDASTFFGFCAVAAGVKLVGVLSSMYRWSLLLRGQGIELPFRHLFGAFLTGRFIGTFLPSTAGLDGYLLYDAARFSGRTVEVTAAKALEKAIGVTGIFLSYLVALPAGIGMFYSILGREAGLRVALLGVLLCLGIVGSLLLVLWFPGLVQWLVEHLPLPGKARLAGIVRRVSLAAAAYKDRKGLVLAALGLSFVVHFTTAAMYYFTALAIAAQGARFWPIVLASSIQILATVLSPVTIAGEGIRELAQLVLTRNMIGPAAAIVSAALGFWAAEAPTLLGGLFWWTRREGYRPAWCRVDGRQVDYAQAARDALALETEEERRARAAAGRPAPPGYRARAPLAAGLGLGSGILAGCLLGGGEALAIARGGFGAEAQVLWYGPLAYALLLGALGAGGGCLLAALPVDEDEVRGWTPALGLLGLLLPLGLAVTLFRLRRDVFLEQTPPLPVLAGVLGAAACLALGLFLLGPRAFRTRAGRVVRPLPSLGLLAALCAAGALAGRALVPPAGARPAPPAVPAALAPRPNLLLVMVDTLRADHLSCYGSDLETPNLCSLAADPQGRLYRAYSHSSWTKPATATLLTSRVPTSHGAMSKPSILPEGVETVAEALRAHGYTTGGIVSNINLAESFGFAQGFDEYHYLGPDYLFGARESSSKLVLYQIARSVWFRFRRGLRVGDFYQDSAVVNGVAFEWLERHRGSRFFLFLHYMDPHDPYFAHPYDGHAVARVANQHPDPAQVAEMRRLYRGEVEHLDRNFGELLERLRRLGLYDDTLIVVTADHGEEFHEHGGFWHGLTLYDEQIHVPLLVKWPRGARAPDPGATPVRVIDVAPTLLAAAGAPVPEAMQGVDLADDPAGRAARDRLVFLEEDHEGNVLRGVRSAEWKLVEANPDNPRGLAARELYDLARDPGETANLAGTRPEVAGELAAHAEAQAGLARRHAAGEAGAASLSASEQEALRALGYVE